MESKAVTIWGTAHQAVCDQQLYRAGGAPRSGTVRRGRLRRCLDSTTLLLIVLLVLGAGLRGFNLAARDPFIDEVNWINAAIEHVHNVAAYTDPQRMPVILHT